MTLRGVDYSSGPIAPAQLAAAGLSFVCRYVSTPGEWKNVTGPEAADLLGAGLGLVIVYEEHPVTRPLGGYGEGAADAAAADAQVAALGLGGCPIYFAVDFDVVPGQLAAVVDYMRGAASVVGPPRVGAYGSHFTIRSLFDVGVIRYGWAADAWGGTLDGRAHLLQSGGGTVAGTPVDFDRTVSSDTDYGQFNPHVPVSSWISDLLHWSA